MTITEILKAKGLDDNTINGILEDIYCIRREP